MAVGVSGIGTWIAFHLGFLSWKYGRGWDEGIINNVSIPGSKEVSIQQYQVSSSSVHAFTYKFIDRFS